MQINGSCNCGSVRYSCDADGPVPYMRCYCDNCRKTGSGGYMVNLLARACTLEVQGRELTRIHRAPLVRSSGNEIALSQHERHFCGECGSHLWAFNPEWPELLHPVASSIDTALPKAPVLTHIFVRSKPDWVDLERGPSDLVFAEYPDESIRAWHERHGLYEG